MKQSFDILHLHDPHGYLLGPMNSLLSDYLSVFKSRRMAVMLLLGLSSGLPLALTGGTLQAWMAVDGVNLRTIGIFSLVGLPYTLKFIWSPVMDRFVPPWLGRRRGWMVTTQLILIAGIALMGMVPPKELPFLMAGMAVFVAFFSASQDIVVDAYRTDLLEEPERGLGTAIFVTGYRVGMLMSGALAMIMSDRIGWQNTYSIMALAMGIGIGATLFSPEPVSASAAPGSLREAVTGPLEDFFRRPAAMVLLLFVILYKLGDAYAGSMTTAFLIRGAGFSPSEVGTVNKGLGLMSVILGATLGGTLMVRLGMFQSLLLFGLLQAVSILSFIPLVWTAKNYSVMVGAVAFENLTGGMGTAAFVALLMSLCNSRFSATQFALLSSIASLGRVFITPTSGFVAEYIGWGWFFVFAAMTALPGLLLLVYLRKYLTQLKQPA